ncbi:MAG: sulfite exporter TauE/SafE family protein [Anaerolineae bacterium]
MSLAYWFMFPIAILVATTAMASGVEGATFFAPILILLLGFPPEVAIGIGLITEVFGFASGLYAYQRKRLIDYSLGSALLVATIPLALVGTWLSGVIAPDALKVILGIGLLGIAVSFLRVPADDDILLTSEEIAVPHRSLLTAQGEIITYPLCNINQGRLFAGIGSLFMGMISTGLGEMNGYYLLRRCRMPSNVAVATSVFVVAITALVASAGHVLKFLQADQDALLVVFSVVIFTVPGVIIGGQLGAIVASRISQHILERVLAMLFVLVALVMLGDAFL